VVYLCVCVTEESGKDEVRPLAIFSAQCHLGCFDTVDGLTGMPSDP